MTISKPPSLLRRVPSPIPCALSLQLQEILDHTALFRISGPEIEDETDRHHGHSKRESQVDRGPFVKPWGVTKEPRGHDAADVDHSQAERDRRRTAVVWLYVVRLPCDEAGCYGIRTYDLEKECAIVGRFVLRSWRRENKKQSIGRSPR